MNVLRPVSKLSRLKMYSNCNVCFLHRAYPSSLFKPQSTPVSVIRHLAFFKRVDKYTIAKYDGVNQDYILVYRYQSNLGWYQSGLPIPFLIAYMLGVAAVVTSAVLQGREWLYPSEDAPQNLIPKEIPESKQRSLRIGDPTIKSPIAFFLLCLHVGAIAVLMRQRALRIYYSESKKDFSLVFPSFIPGRTFLTHSAENEVRFVGNDGIFGNMIGSYKLRGRRVVLCPEWFQSHIYYTKLVTYDNYFKS